MKNKKLIFIGIGLIGIYLLYKKFRKSTQSTSINTPSTTTLKPLSKIYNEKECVDRGGVFRVPSSTILLNGKEVQMYNFMRQQSCFEK